MELRLDDTLLINNYLNSRVFKYEHASEPKIWEGSIELIIRPECNQKCDYCYITQHGDDLYPKEYRADNKTILHNLKMLLDYFIERKTYPREFEIFAGDLFYDNIWFDIMDIFIDYYKTVVKIFNFTEEELKKLPFHAGMPCNCSFFHDKEKTERISKYIDDMKQYGIRFHFSWSHDGPELTNIREKRELDEEFYNTAFKFLKRHHFGAHPMISYEGIDKMIETYNWWMQKMEETGIKEQGHDLLPMFLEVRNDGWTQDKINKYIEFLDYVVTQRFELCDKNPETMACHIFLNPGTIRKFYPNVPFIGYVPNDILWLKGRHRDQSYMNCTFGKDYSINVSKLTLVPCHRLTYEFLEGAEFICDNKVGSFSDYVNLQLNNDYLIEKLSSTNATKIIGIKAKESTGAYLTIEGTNPLYKPKCCNCEYRFICMNQCYGSCFESYGDWNMPIPSVCNLLKAKYDFLFKKYYELGLFKYIFEHPDFPINKQDKEYFLEILQRKGVKEFG